MVKKEMTYQNFNGETIKEELYFHLTQTEWLLIDADYQEDGGLKGYIEKAVKNEDRRAMLHLFTKLIKQAYGIKSGDGKRFIKSEQLSEEFSQTEAFSDLIVGFLSDTDEGIAFFNSLAPKDIEVKEKSVPIIQPVSE